MKNSFFNNIHLTNFKSLKNVALEDCKRINLLIGKPNVGKSNILEAIGLFSLSYFQYNNNKQLTQFIRLDNLTELFFDGNKEQISRVIANNGMNYNTTDISYKNPSQKRFGGIIELKTSIAGSLIREKHIISINHQLNISTTEKNIDSSSKVKYYKFTHDISNEDQDERINYTSYLVPPVGINLIETIQENKELKKELVELFLEYGLKLLFDKGSNVLRIMKETKDGEIFSLPYNSIADTLHRVIFFKAAIMSNKDSILLFEEPEAHCFPPYIAHFTQEVINAKTNQFFIATHSPYVLNDFLEDKETRNELAIFFADFKEGQTVINRLSDEEIEEVYDYGIDVFFNYERFTS